MKIKDMIDMVDKLTPNAYETVDKIQWLKHLDLQIYDEVISGCEGYEQISMGEYDIEHYDDTQLLAPDMFSDLYRWYLEAQIGKANGETARYRSLLVCGGSGSGKTSRIFIKTLLERTYIMD